MKETGVHLQAMGAFRGSGFQRSAVSDMAEVGMAGQSRWQGDLTSRTFTKLP